MEEKNNYRKAKAMVHKLKQFYIHVLVFVIVNTGLIILNVLVSPGQIWFFWPLIGWTVGLLIHANETYGKFTIFTTEWENKKIREFLKKLDEDEVKES